MKAEIGTIGIKVTSNFRDIASFFIEGLAAGYIMKASHSQANVNLSSINVKDLNTSSVYKNVSKILVAYENVKQYVLIILILILYRSYQ